MKRELVAMMAAVVVLGGAAYAADTTVRKVTAFDRVGTTSVGEVQRKRFQPGPEIRGNLPEREAHASRKTPRPDALPERRAELVRRLLWLMIAAR